MKTGNVQYLEWTTAVGTGHMAGGPETALNLLHMGRLFKIKPYVWASRLHYVPSSKGCASRVVTSVGERTAKVMRGI